MFKIFDSLALIAFCSLIYWLSAQQSLPMPMVFELQDKLHHMVAYFVMGILAWRFLRHVVKISKLTPIIALAFCSLYGVSDEWHQSFVPGRSSEMLDWVADTLGAGFAQYLITRFSSDNSLINKIRGKTVQNP